ncbi:MAG: alpha/beta hydrolase [Candidatus Levybacteria bacterium]|nr:alpha/beta hydrolase [Candidatus Levybacteria bacterium]
MDPNPVAESELQQPAYESEIPETPQRESLDEKFPRQTIEFGGLGAVAFRDIVPEMIRPGGEIPMVMMTGWAMNQEVIGNTTEALFDAGQRVIPFDIEGGAHGLKERFGDEIDRQAELLKKWMDTHDDDKFHLVGQSMSALVLLSLLENHPEMKDKVASMILVSPMGLAGDPAEHGVQRSEKGFRGRIFDAAKRGVIGKKLDNLLQRKAVEDGRNNQREKTDEDRQIEERVERAWKGFLKNHWGRAAKEGFAMAGANEYNALNLLKAMGLKVGIVQGAQDQLNSAQGLVENIARQAVSNSQVRPELIGDNGMEKIPDELKILDSDSEEEKNRKRKAIIDIKMELQRTENKVPLDSLTLVEGGHEIFGPKAIATTLTRTADNLVRDDEQQQISNQELQDIARVREELANETR